MAPPHGPERTPPEVSGADNDSRLSPSSPANNDESPSSNASISSPNAIALPELKYGYRTDPFDWPELVEIIRVENNLERLCRTREQQRDYEIYKRGLRKKWRSVNDFVLVDKFGLERRVDTNNNGLFYAYPASDQVRGVRKKLVRNDFPYHMMDHIEHWIYWKLGEPISDDEIVQAKKDIQDQLGGDVQDFLHWLNPPHLQSLPDIHHIHILCLRRF